MEICLSVLEMKAFPMRFPSESKTKIWRGTRRNFYNGGSTLLTSVTRASYRSFLRGNKEEEATMKGRRQRVSRCDNTDSSNNKEPPIGCRQSDNEVKSGHGYESRKYHTEPAHWVIKSRSSSLKRRVKARITADRIDIIKCMILVSCSRLLSLVFFPVEGE